MTNSDYTHIALIVDRSGSMTYIAHDMNPAILKLLEDQAAESTGKILVDITTFDTKIEHPYQGVHPLDVKGTIIVPRNATALNDAVGYTITELGERFAAMPEDERPGNVIVVVVTDGYENSSREYTTDAVRALVKRQTEQYQWTFMYLATGVDAFATGSAMGYAPEQTIAFTASSVGVENTYGGLHSNISRASRGDRSGFTQEEREAAEQE